MANESARHQNFFKRMFDDFGAPTEVDGWLDLGSYTGPLPAGVGSPIVGTTATPWTDGTLSDSVGQSVLATDGECWIQTAADNSLQASWQPKTVNVATEVTDDSTEGASGRTVAAAIDAHDGRLDTLEGGSAVTMQNSYDNGNNRIIGSVPISEREGGAAVDDSLGIVRRLSEYGDRADVNIMDSTNSGGLILAKRVLAEATYNVTGGQIDFGTDLVVAGASTTGATNPTTSLTKSLIVIKAPSADAGIWFLDDITGAGKNLASVSFAGPPKALSGASVTATIITTIGSMGAVAADGDVDKVVAGPETSHGTAVRVVLVDGGSVGYGEGITVSPSGAVTIGARLTEILNPSSTKPLHRMNHSGDGADEEPSVRTGDPTTANVRDGGRWWNDTAKRYKYREDATTVREVAHKDDLVADNVLQHLGTTAGIDGTTVAVSPLYTVPAGKQAIITKAVIRLSAVTGFTSVPDIGIGVAAGEDDIVPSQSLTGLDTTGEQFQINVEGLAVIAQATEVVDLGVDVAAVSTTYTMVVDLYGYLV